MLEFLAASQDWPFSSSLVSVSVDAVRVTQSSSVSFVFLIVRFFFGAGFLGMEGVEAEGVGTAVGVERAGRRRVWEGGRERREGVVGIEVEG